MGFSTHHHAGGRSNLLPGGVLVGPLLLVALAGPWVLLLGARVFRIGLGALLVWAALYVVVAAVAMVRPVAVLAALALSCTTLPYLEPMFGIGKQLPVYFTSAALVGCAAGLGSRFTGSMSGRLAWVARPVSLFGNLMLVSTLVATLRYSPLVAGWTDGTPLGWVSRAGVDAIEPNTSRFLLHAAQLASGPLLALVVVLLMARAGERGADGGGAPATVLLGGLLAGLAASLLACLGQATIADFPLPSREPRWPSGLLTNPGPLATLIALSLPVMAGIIASRSLPRWLRGIAAVDLVLSLAALGPLEAKTGQIGLLVGVALTGCLLVATMVAGSPRRRALAAVAVLVAGALLVALAVQLLAAASVSDWDAFASEAVLLFRPGRMERNRQMILMYLDHPVAGTGVGTFSLLLPGYFHKYGTVWAGEAVLPPTNHLLHMAATGGTIVLAATVWLLVALMIPPLRSLLVGSGRRDHRVLVVGLAAGSLTYLFLSNWQGETWYHAYAATPFWMVVAILVGICREQWPRRAGPLDARWICVVVAVYGLASCLGA